MRLWAVGALERRQTSTFAVSRLWVVLSYAFCHKQYRILGDNFIQFPCENQYKARLNFPNVKRKEDIRIKYRVASHTCVSGSGESLSPLCFIFRRVKTTAAYGHEYFNTVTCFSDYRRGLDWWIDILITYRS
jgi:hypothetical protein